MKVGRLFVLFTLLLFASAFAHAINIRGKVLNGTTRKPSAGDEVVLLTLSQHGMSEIGRTQTDQMGRFTFAGEDLSDHLVRVIHQGVTYHKSVESGLNSLVVQVYDVTESRERVNAVMRPDRRPCDQRCHRTVRSGVLLRTDVETYLPLSCLSDEEVSSARRLSR